MPLAILIACTCATTPARGQAFTPLQLGDGSQWKCLGGQWTEKGGVIRPPDKRDLHSRAFYVASGYDDVTVEFEYYPDYREHGGGDAGVIIHVGSIYGREAGGAPGYQTMKSAIHSHAKALALQLASDNIRVNAIAPGSIAWPGSKWQTRYDDDPDTIQRTVLDGIAFGRFGKPEEVANLVAFLASPRASWVTGACINVDGGQTVSIN